MEAPCSMRGRPRSCFASLCFSVMILLLLYSRPAGAVPNLGPETLQQVVVVHRHGARTPLVWANQSVLCGKRGCGVLTEEGIEMLRSLGAYVAGAYNSSNEQPEGPRSGFVLPSEYSAAAIESRSSNYARTAQSAGAFLQGLFGHSPTTTPVYVQTIPKESEQMIRPDKGWPTIVLHNEVIQDELWRLMDNVTLGVVPASILGTIGAEVGFGSECDPSNASAFQPYVCAMDAQDFAECEQSMGSLHRFPVLEQHFRALSVVLMLSNNYSWFAFNDAHYPGYMEQIGSYGIHLVRDIIEGARARVVGSGNSRGDPYGEDASAAGVVLREFSGHDVTLISLMDSLGVAPAGHLHPRFGAAVIFEIHAVNSSSSGGGGGGGGGGRPAVPWIRARFGAPGQLPGRHAYDFDWLPLRCVSPSDGGAGTKAVGGNGCSLSAFEAVVEQRKPQSSAGVCFADAKDLLAADCSPDDAGPPQSTACRTFRSSCPLSSCGPARFVHPETLACVAGAGGGGESWTRSSSALTAVAVPSGACLLSLIALVVTCCRLRSAKATHLVGEGDRLVIQNEGD